eukprot:7362886-Pyramimonas_sp.AAC.2
MRRGNGTCGAGPGSSSWHTGMGGGHAPVFAIAGELPDDVLVLARSSALRAWRSFLNVDGSE